MTVNPGPEEHAPDQDPSDPAGSHAAPENPEELAALRQQAEQAQVMQDNWVRALADLQNLQRRLSREKEMARRLAQRDLIRDLLPCFDNLDRAVQASSDGASDALIQGVSMVSGEIRRVLSEHGVLVLNPVSDPLDPNQHEAIGSRHHETVAEHRIIEVHERGYTLHDMVIRPARVTISLGPPPSPDAPAASDSPSPTPSES